MQAIVPKVLRLLPIRMKWTVAAEVVVLQPLVKNAQPDLTAKVTLRKICIHSQSCKQATIPQTRRPTKLSSVRTQRVALVGRSGWQTSQRNHFHFVQNIDWGSYVSNVHPAAIKANGPMSVSRAKLLIG
jgi:hypothetical protein